MDEKFFRNCSFSLLCRLFINQNNSMNSIKLILSCYIIWIFNWTKFDRNCKIRSILVIFLVLLQTQQVLLIISSCLLYERICIFHNFLPRKKFQPSAFVKLIKKINTKIGKLDLKTMDAKKLLPLFMALNFNNQIRKMSIWGLGKYCMTCRNDCKSILCLVYE